MTNSLRIFVIWFLLILSSAAFAQNQTNFGFYYGSSLSGNLQSTQKAELALIPTGFTLGINSGKPGGVQIVLLSGFDFSAVSIKLGDSVRSGRYTGLLLGGGVDYPLNSFAYFRGDLSLLPVSRMITTSLTQTTINEEDFKHAALSLYEGGMGYMINLGLVTTFRGGNVLGFLRGTYINAGLQLSIRQHDFAKKLDRVSSTKEGSQATEFAGKLSLSSTGMLLFLSIGI